MPRGPRLDSPGLLHHVRLRGVERRDIFMDDVDRESFCERLENVCAGGNADVLAWCLMSNHVHLAIRAQICRTDAAEPYLSTANERIADLLSFSVSREYFELRRALGLSVAH